MRRGCWLVTISQYEWSNVHWMSRWFTTISYLLNRLFLDTMRRKPVGSVTELSLLLSSSNCWSNKSPASLSVSLLEQPLKGRERDGMSCWTVGKEKALQQIRQYTDLYCFSADKRTTHTLDLPRNTHSSTHTLGLISQAWSNTLMVSRVKSFHYNAGDADPVCGEHPPPPDITTSTPLSSIAPFMPKPLFWYHVTLKSTSGTLSSWKWTYTMGSLIIKCSHSHLKHFWNPCGMCLISD